MTLKQIAANQAEISTNNGTTILFSYETPVAAFIPARGAIVTETRWSRTTSKHINQALRRWGATKHETVKQAELAQLAA